MEDFFEMARNKTLTIWDKISLWWRFDGKYYPKFLKYGIKNIIYWFPIIWKDRNWDHSYILTILQHKLKAQAKYIGSKDRHTRAKQDARRMKICINLIEKLQESFYETEYMVYAKEKHWFEPVKGKEGYSSWESEIVWEYYKDYFKKYPLIYKRVMNGEGVFPLTGDTDSKNNQRIAMNIAHINQDRAHQLLFKIMEENIQGWWD
jgi:hypothetical protein